MGLVRLNGMEFEVSLENGVLSMRLRKGVQKALRYYLRYGRKIRSTGFVRIRNFGIEVDLGRLVRRGTS